MLTPPANRVNHIVTIDALRGIAALLVCLVHIGGLGLFGNNILTNIFSFGQWGVYVFFVISGFIIPYSLNSSKYRVKYFFRFILKRIIRIDPPYYIAIILTLALAFLVTLRHGYIGEKFHFNICQFLAHLVYVIPLTKYDWYNHVFWTLCIEVQYYIFIGLLWNFFTGYKNSVRLLSVLLFLGLSFSPFNNYYSLFTYSSAFVTGIITFYFKTAVIDKKLFLFCILLTGIFCLFTVKSPAIALVCLLTAFIIGFINYQDKVLTFLGKISYSLYITHTLIVTIGGYFLKRFIVTFYQEILFLVIELSVCLGFAFIFYRLFEQWFICLSKKISIIPGEKKNLY